MNLTPPPLWQNSHAVRWHCTAESELRVADIKSWFLCRRPTDQQACDRVSKARRDPTHWLDPMTQRQLAEKCDEPGCLNISPSAEPASRAAAATYESANGQMTVTSQVSGFPASQGTREIPPGRFPSDRLRPSGSLVHGMPAETIARATKSSRAWCLAGLPGAFLLLLLFNFYPCLQYGLATVLGWLGSRVVSELD